MVDTLLKIGETFGIPAMILAYFIYSDWSSKKAMTSRLQNLEDYQKNQMQEMTKNSTIVLKANAVAMDRIHEALVTRPCIANEMSNINRERERVRDAG